MNRHSVTPEMPAARAPVFFRITVALLALLLLGGTAGALLLVFEAKSINRSGGWGWLLVGAIYLVAIIVVCFACVICTAVSLYRHEPHRQVSIVILVISGLVVSAVGANLIRATIGRKLRLVEVARISEASARRRADPLPPATIPPSADRSSNTPMLSPGENQQMLELKSK